LHALLFSNGLAGISVTAGSDKSITHLNDVEELSSAMADRFPQFAAGDLLLSMRDLNLIMIIDPLTRTVKWHHTGPWIGQHDPDFEANGKISVFNNNNDGTKTGSILGGSNIIEIDPVNGQTTLKYGSRPTQKMFSNFRSKHQNLFDVGGNPSILITESEAGRVLEVNHKGDIVWEFINRYDDNEIAIMNEAIRYPEDYFAVREWTCK
ncbi:MAG: arylsulfotransferase family protein, partial [Anaerolineae bacterium]|nr:arylsulfotransferase family protein [Anaerolineae bacterium]